MSFLTTLVCQIVDIVGVITSFVKSSITSKCGSIMHERAQLFSIEAALAKDNIRQYLTEVNGAHFIF